MSRFQLIDDRADYDDGADHGNREREELAARVSRAPASDRPFVALNGALPETLLDSELFGHMGRHRR
jgi:hypothetical protein